ncbi:EthD family reductase [Mesorhizobium sp. A556]
MIKFHVMYPPQEGGHFDFDYYVDHHMPLVTGLMGAACVSISLDKGLSGFRAGSEPPFVAQATVACASMDDLKSSLFPHLPTISADIPRFTNIKPVIWVSELVGSKSRK